MNHTRKLWNILVLDPNQLNNLGGTNYLISKEKQKLVKIGDTIIQKNNSLELISIEKNSLVFLLAGKNAGNQMIYKGIRNKQYILTDIVNSEEIPYNDLLFFPLTGKITSLN